MAEKERNKKQFHAIIKEVRKTSEIYKFNSQDQRGMKGWKKEWDSNRMPDRQKKKSLEITLLIHGWKDMTKSNFRGINNMPM